MPLPVDPQMKITAEEIDCSGTDEAVCPHCGFTYPDSWEFVRKDPIEFSQDCDGCGKTFKCRPEYEVTYFSYIPEADND